MWFRIYASWGGACSIHRDWYHVEEEEPTITDGATEKVGFFNSPNVPNIPLVASHLSSQSSFAGKPESLRFYREASVCNPNRC